MSDPSFSANCLKCQNSHDNLTLNCSHTFCRKCLKKSCKELIKKKRKLICSVPNCKVPIPIFTLESVLSEKHLQSLQTHGCFKCKNDKIPAIFQCGHGNCPTCLKKRIKQELKKEQLASCENSRCRYVYSKEDLQFLGLKEKYIKILSELPRKLQNSEVKTVSYKSKPIKQVLPELKENFVEKKRMDILKGKNVCQICLDYLYEEDFLILTCNHKFCKECLQKDWKENISKHLTIICPAESCAKEVNYYLLKDNLSPEEFDKYDGYILQKALNESKQNERKIECPSCDALSLIWQDASYFTCVICKQTYCSNPDCRGDWNKHTKLTCRQYKELNKKAALSDEDMFNKYFQEKKLMKCPKCGATIEKTKNCNFIRCESVVCGKKTVFCYLCGDILKEKKLNEHFFQSSPYQYCVKFMKNEKRPENELELSELKKNQGIEKLFGKESLIEEKKSVDERKSDEEEKKESFIEETVEQRKFSDDFEKIEKTDKIQNPYLSDHRQEDPFKEKKEAKSYLKIKKPPKINAKINENGNNIDLFRRKPLEIDLEQKNSTSEEEERLECSHPYHRLTRKQKGEDFNYCQECNFFLCPGCKVKISKNRSSYEGHIKKCKKVEQKSLWSSMSGWCPTRNPESYD